MSVIQETETGQKTLQVIRCNEPQRIYDLLNKNGIICDKVWDGIMSLSSTAPCIALIQHAMPIIYAAAADRPIGFTALSCANDVFYHNMKYIRIRTRRHTMKRKPYLMSTNHQASLPVQCSVFGETALAEAEEGQRRCAAEETKSTVLYYSNPLSTTEDVIRADGRFLDSCKITRFGQTDDSDLGDRHICEFQHYELYIEGKCA